MTTFFVASAEEIERLIVEAITHGTLLGANVAKLEGAEAACRARPVEWFDNQGWLEVGR